VGPHHGGRAHVGLDGAAPRAGGRRRRDRGAAVNGAIAVCPNSPTSRSRASSGSHGKATISRTNALEKNG
jgi:hypothetical protein